MRAEWVKIYSSPSQGGLATVIKITTASSLGPAIPPPGSYPADAFTLGEVMYVSSDLLHYLEQQKIASELNVYHQGAG